MLPPGEGNNTPQTNSQAGALLPSREVSSPSQATNSTPVSSQAINSTPVSSQASGFPPTILQQLLTFLLGKEAILSQPLLTFLLRKEAILPRQLLTFPWVKEAVLPRQLLTFPQVKEAMFPWQLLTFLLGKEAMLPRPLLSFLPVKEAAFPRPLALPRQVSLAIQLVQSGRAIGVPTGTGHPSLPRRIAPSPGKTTTLLPPQQASPRFF